MSEAFPYRLDPARLARSGSSLRGKLPTRGMTRLAAAVQGLASHVDVALEFTANAGQRVDITGTAATTVSMTCQRCLETTDVDILAGVHLAVVPDEAAAESLEDDVDPVILQTATLDARDLVEDEILLALPLIAMHADKNECSTAAWLDEAATAEHQDEETEKPNPFAVLKNLKQD